MGGNWVRDVECFAVGGAVGVVAACVVWWEDGRGWGLAPAEEEEDQKGEGGAEDGAGEEAGYDGFAGE